MAFSLVLALAAATAQPAALAEFEAKLASHDSATQALGEWCEKRHLADLAVIKAQLKAKGRSPIPPVTIRRMLTIGLGDAYALRHVDLVCGTKVLSVAWNWYNPARLTKEMNAALAESDVPFGKVTAPLKFRRAPLKTVKGRIAPCPANTISTHRALLVLPDGNTLAYVIECYTAANLKP